MNELIKDIFDKYQIRKSKKQKTAFIEYTLEQAKKMGFHAYIDKGVLGVRNIVVGNPNTAKVIYTAHYDTCSRLPFPNILTPKKISIYILYNILITLMFFGIGIGVASLLSFVEALFALKTELTIFTLIFLYCLLIMGPANKHTANDNTSGIMVLFGIMKNMTDENKDKVALIFFDLEEAGLIGSASFASTHKDIKNNKLLINFDCVSDGKNMLIFAKKNAEKYNEKLKEAFVSTNDIVVEVTNKGIYPSDQGNFKIGVGVASFNKTKRGMLYMDKIHTSKDTVFQKENIDFLIESANKLIEIL